ncbi:DUF4064 domain-containing protein [Virgibacillus kekensis]|uniref:DUF4064 domain-containing protein n=1 Tax=Virgibacillus kekensis TaxID=202261 RepID=A0ABV9DKZ9_9BACI
MSRIGEMVLTIIGVILYFILALLGGATVWISNNEELWRGASEQMIQQDPQLTAANLDDVMGMIGNGGWFLLIVSVIGAILGIVAAVLLKGDKKPKAAGILLIVTAVVGAIVTFGAGIISGLFYLIAGIMALARRSEPKQSITIE